jgi:adenosylcobinamide-phosphate synthase
VIGARELIFAFFLDLVIGDPRWLPHPVRIIGRGITMMENFLRKSIKINEERTAGIYLVISIVIPTVIITLLAQKALLWFSTDFFMIIGMIILIYLIATTLALRELVNAALLVINAVRDGNLERARRNLAMIVGRDTAVLPEEAILRATIETLAENLSDGFIAPLFYLVIGGLPLAMAYKAINTLDSMVGYKNEQYLRFGWAAAKLDDAANYIPARMAGMFIVSAVFLFAVCKDPLHALQTARRSYSIMRRDGRNHTSPNSGVPEAAMAGALGVKLGGPSTYGGALIEKPRIGDDGAADYCAAAGQAVALTAVAASVAITVAACILSIKDLT